MIYLSGKCVNAEFKSFECGREECESGHSWGPGIRQCCLFHYVERGKGIFKINGKTHYVDAGQVFYIPPKTITYYEADKENPWVYRWVGAEGRNIEKLFENGGLSAENAVFTANQSLGDVMDDIIGCADKGGGLKLTCLLYRFLDILGACENNCKRTTSSESYVAKAREYIHARVHRKITVREVSDNLSIDRSYLASLFRKETGMSPQQYILNEKMQTACEYLLTTDYDISHIAQSVGYEDVFVFSHIFKKTMGISPSGYRSKG